MKRINLPLLANQLPTTWCSSIAGKAGGANLKVLRMDEQSYPAEIHEFDEALLVLEGQLNLEIEGEVIPVRAGEVFIVPAGMPHAVARGSIGTLVIVDA